MRGSIKLQQRHSQYLLTILCPQSAALERMAPVKGVAIKEARVTLLILHF